MVADLFHVIDDAQVVLRSKGVFRQAKVYERCNKLYAAWGSGFITIGRGGLTSLPNVSWLVVHGVDDGRMPR